MFMKKIKYLKSYSLTLSLLFFLLVPVILLAQEAPKDIYFGAKLTDRINIVGELCLGGVCTATWPVVESGGAGDVAWQTSGNNVFYNVSNGNVGIGKTTPSAKLDVSGTVKATNFDGPAATATSLASDGTNCSAGFYPLGVDAQGNAQVCTKIEDVYWSGTATNLNATTARTSLGLGTLATLSTITNTHVATNAAIASTKLADGAYMINSAGSSGQVWTSTGSGRGQWTTIPTGPTGGVSGSGTTNYIPKWSNASTLTNSLIYDNGTNVGIGTTAPNAKLQVAGTIRGTTIYATTFSGSFSGNASSASRLSMTPGLCAVGYAPRGVDYYGDPVGCTEVGGTGGITQDIYWSGTATNLNAATGRTSLGLGALATLSTITNTHVATNAAIASTKLADGAYMINSAGSSGQVWTSTGSGRGQWTTISTGGIGGSGISNRVARWTAASTLSYGILYDTGSRVGIGKASPNYELDISGSGYATNWYTNSDARLKINVASINNVLPKLMNLRGVSYNWDQLNYPERNFSNQTEYGFIAQEVEKEFPNLVVTDGEGYKALMYDRFSAVLVEAIKEQQAEIESLKGQINKLQLMINNNGN